MQTSDFGDEEEEEDLTKPETSLPGPLDSPIHDGSVQQVLELILDENDTSKSEIHKGSRSGLSTVITADLELGDAEMSLVEEVDLDAGSSMEGESIHLDDGSTSYVDPLSPKDADDPGHLNDCLNRFNGQAVQLEDGSTAFLHSTPGEGYQAIQLEDGTTAYISLSPPEHIFEESNSMPLDDESKQILEPSLTGSAKSSAKAMALGNKAFKCSYPDCSKVYTTHHHLKVHERSHTGDRPFQCPENHCAKTFTTSYSLKSHIRVHTGETPYHCPDDSCTKAFKTSGDLQKHIRTHTGERPFACPFEGCDRSFTTSNIRKVHIRTHTGERPYLCKHDGCGRSFASATNYKNHQRIHTGEKPYMCSVPGCRRRFTEYSSLYKHHVVHTVARPYTCDLCGRNYRQNSTLAIHKRSSHGVMIDPLQLTEEDANLLQPGASNHELNQTTVSGDIESLSTASESNTNIDGTEGNMTAACIAQSVAVNSSIVSQPQTMHSMLLSTLNGKSGETTLLTIRPQLEGSSTINKAPQQQILLVTDPTQLAVLQQLVQQAKLGQLQTATSITVGTQSLLKSNKNTELGFETKSIINVKVLKNQSVKEEEI